MKTKNLYVALLLTLAVIITGCGRNYYSGTGKGSSCGCPANPR